MPFPLKCTCGKCGAVFNTQTLFEGRSVPCPTCNALVSIPFLMDDSALVQQTQPQAATRANALRFTNPDTQPGGLNGWL